MLEEKIAELTEAVIGLTDRLDRLWDQGHASEAKKVAESTKEPEKSEKAPAEETKTPEHTITAPELTKIALEAVRIDKSLKDKIKALVRSYGAELIQDVDPRRYPELKKGLLNIKETAEKGEK
jgi:hypothetical protein